jgi:ABC-type Zn2+ transport system substrate-binding protein/surface adhesin
MNQVLPNFLHNEGEDTFVEQEFEPVVIHREELSVEEEAMLFDNESTVTETVVPITVVPNRQLTLEEVIEMAELEAEAAQFDSDLESSDEEDYTDEEYNEDWENDEQEEDEEEMQRHEETAHTVYPYTPLNSFIDANGNTITNLAPHPADSLVERMRPLQDAYNVQMLQAQQRGQLQAEREVVRGWQSVIQLVDDTE